MTASTVIRALKDSSVLVKAAKEHNHSFIFGIKRFFHCLFTLGMGRSLQQARTEHREEEIVEVGVNLLHKLPKQYEKLINEKIIYTNHEKNYELVQEKKELCLYEGAGFRSKFDISKNFIRNNSSRIVLKSFNSQNELDKIFIELSPIKVNDLYAKFNQKLSISKEDKPPLEQQIQDIEKKLELQQTKKLELLATHKELEQKLTIIKQLQDELESAEKEHCELAQKFDNPLYEIARYSDDKNLSQDIKEFNILQTTNLNELIDQLALKIITIEAEITLINGKLINIYDEMKANNSLEKLAELADVKQQIKKYELELNNLKNLMHSDESKRKIEATIKIQKNFRKFNLELKAVKPNKYGIREYKEHLFLANFKRHLKPEETIKNGASGTYKKVIGSGGGSILFETKQEVLSENNQLFESLEVEEILSTIGMTAFKTTARISEDQFIAHNAGSMDMSEALKERKFYPYQFYSLLRNLKTIHQNGYSHGDIKPNNIMFDDKKSEDLFSLIDWDFFSSTSNVSLGGTPRYYNENLIKEIKKSKGNHKKLQLLLQLKDEYAFAKTLLEVNGVKFSIIKSKNGNFISYNAADIDKQKDFIKRYIKPDCQERFTLLLTDPHQYYLKYKDQENIHLSDMINLF